MTQNDFYVAIQFILEKALDEGWTLEKIESETKGALDEFIVEMEHE